MTASKESRFATILAPGLVQVLVALVASVVVATAIFASVDRVGKSFPGFFVWENLVVPALGEANWTGAESGVEYLSWLRSADGRTLRNGRELTEMVEGLSPGTSLNYIFEKEGRLAEVEVEVMRFGWREWVSVLGLFNFDAVALLILGIVVLYMKPDDSAARALFLFSANGAAYLAASADMQGSYLLRMPYFFFFNLVPATTFYLVSCFPVGRIRRRWEDGVFAALLGLGFAYGIATNYFYFRDHDLLLILERMSYLPVALGAVMALAFYAYYFFTTDSLVVRQRTKVVLFGTALAFAPMAVVLPAVFVGGAALPVNLSTVLFVVYPVSIGYAVARHDLFGIDKVIKRALVYTVLSALVLGIYTLTLGMVDYLFEGLTAAASRVAEGVIILGLLVVSNPSRVRIQAFVDRVYDRRRYDYRGAVRSASRSFSSILIFEELVRAVLELVDETLQPVCADILSVDEDGVVYRRGRLVHAAGEQGGVRTGLGGAAASSLAPLAMGLNEVDLLAEAQQAGEGHEADVEAAMLDLDAVFVLPMRLEGRLVGMVSVGQRRAGGYHGDDDVELLRTVCDQLAVALENAQAYSRIDQLNRGLEESNLELNRTNIELRETQGLLVQKERLAAVGELSAAVAHAIRNPLAGIKAAAQLAILEADQEEGADLDEQVALRDIVSETDRLNDRIAALLDYSRPFEPSLTPGSMEKLAAEVMALSVGKATERSIELHCQPDPGQPLVLIDKVLFEQVIMELVANALDASPDAGRVQLTSGHDEEHAWLEVTDSGAGLKPDKASRIFDLFFTTKASGTGFGLATVKKIVDQHGGTVTAENAEQGGAIFRVELPLA